MKLEWTDKPPTMPGWYWVRWQNRIEIIYVYDHKGELACQWIGDDCAYFVEGEKDVEQWAGPIPEPTEE